MGADCVHPLGVLPIAAPNIAGSLDFFGVLKDKPCELPPNGFVGGGEASCNGWNGKGLLLGAPLKSGTNIFGAEPMNE